jgi:hypothetical protein
LFQREEGIYEELRRRFEKNKVEMSEEDFKFIESRLMENSYWTSGRVEGEEESCLEQGWEFNEMEEDNWNFVEARKGAEKVLNMMHPFIIGGCSKAEWWNNLRSRNEYLGGLRDRTFGRLFNDDNGINVWYAMKTVIDVFNVMGLANEDQDPRWMEKERKEALKLVRDYLDDRQRLWGRSFVLDVEGMVSEVVGKLYGYSSNFYEEFVSNFGEIYKKEISSVRRNSLKQERIREVLKMVIDSSYWETGEIRWKIEIDSLFNRNHLNIDDNEGLRSSVENYLGITRIREVYHEGGIETICECTL